MFKTDRTPWKMHLLPSDLADRCFRVFCRWVSLGGWGKTFFGPNIRQTKSGVFSFSVIIVGGWGGQGEGRIPKTIVSQNVLKHALILECLSSDTIFQWGGGGGGLGSKNKSCSECAETCSRFGNFEI